MSRRNEGCFGRRAFLEVQITEWFPVSFQEFSGPNMTERKGYEYRAPALGESDGEVVEDRSLFVRIRRESSANCGRGVCPRVRFCEPIP